MYNATAACMSLHVMPCLPVCLDAIPVLAREKTAAFLRLRSASTLGHLAWYELRAVLASLPSTRSLADFRFEFALQAFWIY